MHKHAKCSPEAANNAVRSHHSCPHLSTCCSCALRGPAAPASRAASSDAATSASKSRSSHCGCALHARGQRCSSQTHKNQGLQLLGSRCCRHIQPKATCCFVVPMQLHAKLLQVQIHWAWPCFAFTSAKSALLGAQQDQKQAAHLRSATARPRRCLPCAARRLQSPAVRVDALPRSLAAIWPIRAAHSRCRLCSAPAVPARVRNHALTRTATDSTLSDTCLKGATKACAAPAQHQVCSQH